MSTQSYNSVIIQFELTPSGLHRLTGQNDLTGLTGLTGLIGQHGHTGLTGLSGQHGLTDCKATPIVSAGAEIL